MTTMELVNCLNSVPIKNVGARIRMIREIRSMSQKKLGEKIGLSRQMVAKYERGDIQYHLKALPNLQKIAKVLQVDLFDLLSTK